MFDKIIRINPEIKVTENKTVIEKRAPTDDSIRLLNEMQESAFKNMLDSVNLKSNDLHGCAIMTAQIAWKPFSKIVKYKFILNGVEHFGDFEINDPHIIFDEKMFMQILCEELAKHVTNVLIQKYICSDKE